MVNVGSVDRTLRFVLGVVLLAAPFLPSFTGYFAEIGAWKYAVAGAGIAMLGTAIFRFCPAYRVLGIRTCKLKES